MTYGGSWGSVTREDTDTFYREWISWRPGATLSMEDIMFVMMWVLVLYLNPEQFYEQYRTKDNLEKGIRAFREEWACEHAKQALERGVNLGWVDGSHFGCVYEETFMYPKEYQ